MWRWLDRLARRVTGPPRDLVGSDFSISDPLFVQFLGGLSAAGVPITERNVLGISAFYRAGCLITGTIAGLPLRVVRDRVDPDTGTSIRERVRSWLDDPAGPDSYTPFEWCETSLWHVFLHGNVYWMHRFNGAGALAGLHPVHPLCVDVKWADEYRGRRVVGGKLFTATIPGDELDPTTRTMHFDATTMTQVMGPTLDGLKGMSLLRLARTSLGTSIAGDESAARMFRNGPLIAGLVTPEEDLEPSEADAIRDDVNSRMTGSENAGRIAVINRRLKFQPWTMSAEDAQFLGSRQFQIEEVARWTGIPPHLLMQTEKQTSWGTGVQQQEMGLRRFNLVGYTSRMEQRLTKLTPRPQFVEFDFAGLERGSAADEIDLLLKQTDGGLLTINEARRVRNLPPVPGGDVVRIGGTPLDAAPAIEPVPAGTSARLWAEAVRTRSVRPTSPDDPWCWDRRPRETIRVNSQRADRPLLLPPGGNRP